ncbi:polymer biosynthesis protein, WecB/TagA/CpsF family [Abditibacterium utsteinense]|uniref:Polymer biosynthesis protein, WecB/TagA/CpsF family n=1 Tax=Abditibacterium utsteinense TaxID=1960156 RepID=A0A2S8SWY0_9BACT|nr:WecB/TagA/CpsF family glycosyltransferase [Abditibacterium utsteinense]PQV65284.1 polymer biosynthesis protein, WecB/TagA/CpsF family [Abditibacterium utsteinense]
MFLLLFVAAAVLVSLCLRSSQRLSLPGGARAEGFVFVLGVLLVGMAGIAYLAFVGDAGNDSFSTPEAVMARSLVPEALLTGAKLCLLAFAVYVFSALRGAAGLPAWIADVLVIFAATLAVRADSGLMLSIATSSVADAPVVNLGAFTTPLTVGWIWLVSRLCAGLSRVPAVTSGYLGLFAGLIFLLVGDASGVITPALTATLAGAGLAAFVLGLRTPHLNLGWSATLAMGFVLGLCSAHGLLQSTLPAIIALAILALGLPLLNVTLVQVRAKLRGQDVQWSQSRQHLHEALGSRGVPPRKIALLYFTLGFWGCSLAYGVTRWFESGTPNLFVALIYSVLLLSSVVGGSIVFFSIARILMRRVPGEEVPESIEAFGVKISPVSMCEALDKIEEFIASGTPHHVLTSDANAILTSRGDAEYADIMRHAALTTPDGFGVIWGARLLNLPIYERVTGVDMVTGICERAAQKSYRLYILGSEEGVAALAARNLMERYPGLQVVGTHHGFWRRDGKEAGLSSAEADAKMAEEIAAQRVDVLFVAMGIPMQEKFIAAQLQRMKTPVALGVGGSFDVYAGKFNRAPQTVQRLGLEWLYRVWIDPSRWKRMGYVPKFMIVALRTWLFGSKNGGATPDAF